MSVQDDAPRGVLKEYLMQVITVFVRLIVLYTSSHIHACYNGFPVLRTANPSHDVLNEEQEFSLLISYGVPSNERPDRSGHDLGNRLVGSKLVSLLGKHIIFPDLIADCGPQHLRRPDVHYGSLET
ncbi:hypothetical protein C8J56DRAFT_1046118 [Mycena floridula]|nr:hypothetical protein C8J56DRAFT_1046118 [Mycena floridula]